MSHDKRKPIGRILCFCGCGEWFELRRWHLSPSVLAARHYKFFVGQHRERKRPQPPGTGAKISRALMGNRNGKSGMQHYNWKGGRAKQGKYWIRWIGPRQYVYEHRWVMEQRLGRKLTTDEVVHHRNRDHYDNRLENLVVMTKDEHQKHHYHERPIFNGRFGKYPILNEEVP